MHGLFTRALRQVVTFFGTHQRKKPRNAWLFEFGGSGEIRTRDQRIKSPLLYRLSYRPR